MIFTPLSGFFELNKQLGTQTKNRKGKYQPPPGLIGMPITQVLGSEAVSVAVEAFLSQTVLRLT